MRRIWILCVLFTSITTAGALAAKGIRSSSTTHAARLGHPTQRGDTIRDSLWRTSRGPTTPRHKPVAHHPRAGKHAVLFGDQTVEPHVDFKPAGRAESFPFADATTGTAQTLSVYLDSRNHAKKLIAGIYSNRNGRPGSLLASGSLSSPTRGAWNTVALRSRTVHLGRIYWVAILGKGGTLSFRDRSANVCRSATSSQRSLAVLPTSWKTGRAWANCPISAYVSGTVSSSGSVPCALTHAAGADGTSSCWATHTGVRNGTGYTEAQIKAGAPGFTKINGDVIITTSGTVIDHYWITGCIQIADGANNVTVKSTLLIATSNCSGDNAAGSAINTGQGPNIGKNTLLMDVTVDGGTPPYGSHTQGVTLDGGKGIRLNIFGFAQPLISDTNTAQYPAYFQDVYTHDMYGCSHDDGTWFDSSSYVTFEHGWVMTNDPTQQGNPGCSTAALAGGSDYGPQDHIVFDNSYAEGVTGEDTHAGCGSTYSAYTNNALSTNAKDYGSGFVATDVGNTWSGNYVVDQAGANLGPISDPQGPTCPG